MDDSTNNTLQVKDKILKLAPHLITIIKDGFKQQDSFVSQMQYEDVTTQLDLQLNEFIYKEFSNFGIVIDSEESPAGEVLPNQLLLRVDPIDGSKHFALGIDIVSSSVSIIQNNQVVFGMVVNPFSDSIYQASKGEGAFLNGRPIKVSTAPLADSFVFYEQPYACIDDEKRRRFELLFALNNKSRRMRNIGNFILSCCYVAQGSAGGFIDLSGTTKLYDIEASLLIAQEAGAEITTLDGKSSDLSTWSYSGAKKILDNKPLLIANKQVASELKEIILESL